MSLCVNDSMSHNDLVLSHSALVITHFPLQVTALVKHHKPPDMYVLKSAKK